MANFILEIEEIIEEIQDFETYLTDEFNYTGPPLNLQKLLDKWGIFTITGKVTYDDSSGITIFSLPGTLTIQGDQQKGDLVEKVFVEVNAEKTEAKNGFRLKIPVVLGSATQDVAFDLILVDSETSDISGTTQLSIGVGQFVPGLNPNSDGLTLPALAGALFPGFSDLVPTDLQEGCLTLKPNFVLIWSKQSDDVSATTKFMIGVGIGSNLSFKDLPLIGSQIENVEDGKVTLELIATIGDFSLAELETINALLVTENVPLTIQPHEFLDGSGMSDTLPQGLHMVTYIKLGPIEYAWSIRLMNLSGSQLAVRDLDLSRGEHHLLASPRTTNEDNSPPITFATNAAWVTIDRAFGPIHLEKIGLTYKQGLIQLIPQFTLQVGNFSLSLSGVSIGAPIGIPNLDEIVIDYTLDGFALRYASNKRKSITIAGAFLRKEGNGYDEFIGTAALEVNVGGKSKPKSVAFSAIGAYAIYNDEPSIFLYFVVDYPMGGTMEVFITGLAFGFGYNRDLKVPRLENLADFPLVKQAVDGIGAPDADADLSEVINEQLRGLGDAIPITLGAGFLALGVKFTTYNLINSFGLLTLSLSQNNLVVNLLGFSSLEIPPNGYSIPDLDVDPLLVQEMVVQGTFDLDEGYILIQSQLTPNSYIFSKNCKITGGSALAFWFGGDHEGDFVYTLGGYHPKFNRPDHYPVVPRLGYELRLDNHASFTGQFYFALCAHALMGGGHLKFQYRRGKVHASFEVGADFLISWQPYYYDINAKVKIRGGIGCISVSVRVSLHLWGPELGGEAKIDLWLVSAKVRFGDRRSVSANPISWDDFQGSFLPDDKEICSMAVTDGLLRQLAIEDGEPDSEIWVVNPKTFELVTDSFIPCKEVYRGTEHIDANALQAAGFGTDFAIKPMGVTTESLQTSHKVTIMHNDQDVLADKFILDPVGKKSPTGVWGQPRLDGNKLKPPGVNDAQFIDNTCTGFRVAPVIPDSGADTKDIDVKELQYDAEINGVHYILPDIEGFGADSSLDDETRFDRISNTIDTNAERDALLGALGFNPSCAVNVNAGTIVESLVFAPQVK